MEHSGYMLCAVLCRPANFTVVKQYADVPEGTCSPLTLLSAGTINCLISSCLFSCASTSVPPDPLSFGCSPFSLRYQQGVLDIAANQHTCKHLLPVCPLWRHFVKRGSPLAPVPRPCRQLVLPSCAPAIYSL
ncbi:hypothetical protein ABBQ32_008765 [Trebouxia sp. C0010 RCD-2024]